MIFHTENLLVLHVLALALAPAADAWAIGARRARAAAGERLRLGDQAAGRADRRRPTCSPAIAKLRIAGIDWIDGELLRNQIAIDNLRKALLGDSIAPLATQFLDHPAGFTVFSVMTLVLELGAPIALVGGRLGAAVGAAAWGFHVGVVLLMNIWFLYPLLGLAFALRYAAACPVERRRRARERDRCGAATPAAAAGMAGGRAGCSGPPGSGPVDRACARNYGL